MLRFSVILTPLGTVHDSGGIVHNAVVVFEQGKNGCRQNSANILCWDWWKCLTWEQSSCFLLRRNRDIDERDVFDRRFVHFCKQQLFFDVQQLFLIVSQSHSNTQRLKSQKCADTDEHYYQTFSQIPSLLCALENEGLLNNRAVIAGNIRKTSCKW